MGVCLLYMWWIIQFQIGVEHTRMPWNLHWKLLKILEMLEICLGQVCCYSACTRILYDGIHGCARTLTIFLLQSCDFNFLVGAASYLGSNSWAWGLGMFVMFWRDWGINLLYFIDWCGSVYVLCNGLNCCILITGYILFQWSIFSLEH